MAQGSFSLHCTLAKIPTADRRPPALIEEGFQSGIGFLGDSGTGVSRVLLRDTPGWDAVALFFDGKSFAEEETPSSPWLRAGRSSGLPPLLPWHGLCRNRCLVKRGRFHRRIPRFPGWNFIRSYAHMSRDGRRRQAETSEKPVSPSPSRSGVALAVAVKVTGPRPATVATTVTVSGSRPRVRVVRALPSAAVVTVAADRVPSPEVISK